MMDYLRLTLYTILAVLGFMLYQSWHNEYSVPTEKAGDMPISSMQGNSGDTLQSSVPTQHVHTGQIIHIVTDVMDVRINTLGGAITETKLLNYPETRDSKNPFILLNEDPKTKYISQSGLIGQKGPDSEKEQALYTVTKTEYQLQPNEDTLTVNLEWQNSQGLKITKAYEFHRNRYIIDVSYKIDNQSSQSWQGNYYMQLLRTNFLSTAAHSMIQFPTYFGAAISSPDKRFEKIKFSAMEKENLDRDIENGWAGIIQHYFVSAWVPNNTEKYRYYTRVTPEGLYVIGMIGPAMTVPSGSTAETKSTFYAGPNIASRLEKIAPGFKLSLDYGIFWPISASLFWLMSKIYTAVGNWGWSIVLVTLFIKLLFYKLSAKSYRSMAAMKKLQPKINALRERLGDDKQKLTQATLDLYRKEKVNPMSGCLPILVQIPVFIGLYWVLIESVELRLAPFIFWIQDLSSKDPYYILPVLMGLSMFLQQRLNPPPADPTQAKVMMLMPIIFTALFINFPAGLMLYWVVNNTLSFLQQWFIMHSIEGK